MDIMAGRETSCGLGGKSLSESEAQGFILPPNMREAFPDADLEGVDYQVEFKLSLNTSSALLTVGLYFSSFYLFCR